MMGSINDYLLKRRREPASRGKGSFGNRLLGQISFSLILFLIVAASINSDNILGDGARYVMGDGITVTNTENNVPDGSTASVSAPVAGDDVSPADDSAPPQFTAPASGVVVTDIAVTSGGFTTSRGILIQGNSGQSVKAAAEGSVLYLGSSSDGYIIQLSHSGGFVSVYQGLSQLSVGAGDKVKAGDTLGITDNGEVTFSLLLNDTEVDPLDYLFE